MSNQEIRDKYIRRLDSRLETLDKESNRVFCAYYNNLINFILNKNKPENLVYLTYSRLKKISCEDMSDENFKLFLGLMIDERVNVLLEKFEAHDFENEDSTLIDFEVVTYCIINEKFINPFTGCEISSKEYWAMITTFFCLSDELVGDLYARSY